jgi:hypothetical protein
MRRTLASSLLVAWIAVTGSGCATEIQVSLDRREDFSHYRTWDWMQPRAEPAAATSGLDRGLELLVRGAIVRGLRDRGYARTTVGRPDILVAYDLTLARELVRRLETPAMQTLSNPHREGGFEVTASRFVFEHYETGTFVLAVLDGGNLRGVWHATAIRRVRDSFLPRVEEVVSEVFERFPPAAEAWF